MAKRSNAKVIALSISVIIHAAIIYYLGSIALDYALPEGTVSSYEIELAPQGTQLETLTPAPQTQPTPPPVAVIPPPSTAVVAEAPKEKLQVSKPANPPTVLPTKEALPETTSENGLDPAFIAAPIPADVPAIDPFAQDVDQKQLSEEALNDSNSNTTETAVPATAQEPTELPVAAVETPSAPAEGAYGRPDGIQSDVVLTPVGGNKKISYPTMARFRKLEGETIVHYTVNGDGAVTDVELIQSSGHGVLDSAVVDTVKTWKFKPTGKEGVYERPVKFSLKGEAAPAPSQLRRQNP